MYESQGTSQRLCSLCHLWALELFTLGRVSGGCSWGSIDLHPVILPFRCEDCTPKTTEQMRTKVTVFGGSRHNHRVVGEGWDT